MSSSSFAIIQKLQIDNRFPVAAYCQIALQILKRADIYRQVKDTISLYVMLLAFSILVSEVKQFHRDYQAFAIFTYNTLEKVLQFVLSELDTLKTEVHEKMTYPWRTMPLATLDQYCCQQLQYPWNNGTCLQAHPAFLGSLPAVIPASLPSNEEYLLRLRGYTILKEYNIHATSVCFSSNAGTGVCRTDREMAHPTGSGSATVNVGSYNAGPGVRNWADRTKAWSTRTYNSGSAEVNVGNYNAVTPGSWANSLRIASSTDGNASGARNIPRDGYTGNYNGSSTPVNTSSYINGQSNSAPTATTFLRKMKKWLFPIPTISPASNLLNISIICGTVVMCGIAVICGLVLSC